MLTGGMLFFFCSWQVNHWRYYIDGDVSSFGSWGGSFAEAVGFLARVVGDLPHWRCTHVTSMKLMCDGKAGHWYEIDYRNHYQPTYSGWWQLKYFLFSPRKLGKMNPFWQAYVSIGLKPPTSKITQIGKSSGDVVFFLSLNGYWKTQVLSQVLFLATQKGSSYRLIGQN